MLFRAPAVGTIPRYQVQAAPGSQSSMAPAEQVRRADAGCDLAVLGAGEWSASHECRAAQVDDAGSVPRLAGAAGTALRAIQLYVMLEQDTQGAIIFAAPATTGSGMWCQAMRCSPCRRSASSCRLPSSTRACPSPRLKLRA